MLFPYSFFQKLMEPAASGFLWRSPDTYRAVSSTCPGIAQFDWVISERHLQTHVLLLLEDMCFAVIFPGRAGKEPRTARKAEISVAEPLQRLFPVARVDVWPLACCGKTISGNNVSATLTLLRVAYLSSTTPQPLTGQTPPFGWKHSCHATVQFMLRR